MVSSARRPAIENVADAVAWVRARPWYYVYVVLVLWGFIPEVRRIIDWRSSFSSINVVSIVPLLSLVPAAIALFFASRLAKVRGELLTAAWLWTGAFVYAYAIGVATGNAPPATYTFLGFMLPMAFGLYVSTFRHPMAELYERIAKFALAISVPISLYAFYQYAFPPGWDLYWIQQTGFVNVGIAAPFAFRPFGTLNGPGPFADFLIGVIILNLPRLRGATPLRLLALALTIAALGVTLVRADWLALAIAAVVFAGLSPRKVQNLSTIAVFAIAFALVGANATAIFGTTSAGIELQRRFESLTSITTDASFLDRQVLFGNALSTALSQPTGEGLGVTGTAAKLGAGGETADFDNGYIARFTEMGYPGMIGYLLALGGMLVFSVRRWFAVTRAGDATAASIVAAAIAMQAALGFLDISGDHHANFAGLLFWLSFAFVFGTGDTKERVS